jgi:hypothetical protein
MNMTAMQDDEPKVDASETADSEPGLAHGAPETASAANEKKPLPEIPKGPQPLEAEVRLPGQPPTKVTLTPVSVTQDGKEATVKVTLPEEERPEAPNLAPLLLVAAAAVLLLVASSKGPASPPAGMFE